MMKLLSATLLAACCIGCASSQVLETRRPTGEPTAFGALADKVVARHDKWVVADTSIDETTRTAYLSESADVKTLIEQPAVDSVAIQTVIVPVLNRYEDYLAGKRNRTEELDALQLDVYWLTAQQVKDIITVATGHVPPPGYDSSSRR